jgi:hypothetical protein
MDFKHSQEVKLMAANFVNMVIDIIKSKFNELQHSFTLPKVIKNTENTIVKVTDTTIMGNILVVIIVCKDLAIKATEDYIEESNKDSRQGVGR